MKLNFPNHAEWAVVLFQILGLLRQQGASVFISSSLLLATAPQDRLLWCKLLHNPSRSTTVVKRKTEYSFLNLASVYFN